MSKNKELIEIKNKYKEKYLNLAKEFYNECGLFIDDIRFSYPVVHSVDGDEVFKYVETRIDVTLN
jgi:hypothetical protein